MFLSQLIGRRYKEAPGDAALASHSILLRGGYIRQVSNGIYSLLPLGLRVIQKIENIVRDEMNRIGGQEVLMPIVLPRELWDESKRYATVGSELLRFKDRTNHDMVLAMTHEEAVVQLSRNEANSYRSYPFILYQIQTKFRDEPRSRGGLIRVREFTMKDAYSFHRDQESLELYYATCAEAYSRIFSRVGIPEVKKVESDTGMMGGQTAHEYMLMAKSGEDTIVVCATCNYIANLEVAKATHASQQETPLELKKVHTPGKRTIDEVTKYLSTSADKTAKVVFYQTDTEGNPVMALIRGDLDVNESKLAKVIGVVPTPADEATIHRTGAVPGFASPIGVQGCRIVADETVVAATNLVTGANEPDYHFMNFDIRRDVQEYEIADISQVRECDPCPHCEGKLLLRRGIEVGKIFQPGTRYTEKMGMRYLDEEGNERIPIMGCYGIGIGRLMASILEARHDDFGPVWPSAVAPFAVHIIVLNLTSEEMETFPKPMYEQLKANGIEVIYDDRDERAGAKFADADLIGAPLRLIFSKRNMDNGTVEWKTRDRKKQGMVPLPEVIEFTKGFLAD